MVHHRPRAIPNSPARRNCARTILAGAAAEGVIDNATAAEEPFRFTCCDANVMVYPGMFGCERSARVTVLGAWLWLTGAIVICVEPGCPATAVSVAPFAGPRLKSGMFTFTKIGIAETLAKFVSPGYEAKKVPEPWGTVVAVTVSI